MKTNHYLQAGAILLVNEEVPSDVLSDFVVAKQWTHNALDTSIVRLSTENMLPGVDLEMELLGFSPDQISPKLGKQKRKKLGFPGWALVHHPEHSRYALERVKELKKASRIAKSRAKLGKEVIDKIGEKLGTDLPELLPSFYEEVASMFLSFENYTFAAQYFEKARNAERVYALDVDPEMREQSFVDAALSRALSIKSLTHFCQEMINEGKAEEGFQSYYRIAVRRTRGGLPPSPTMAKDLKKLAKAAGIDFFEEEKHFLKELIEAPAIRMASKGFWTAYKKACLSLAKEDLHFRGVLLDLFPSMHPRPWLELLDACDACLALYTDVPKEAKSKYHVADWFSKIISQLSDIGSWRGGDDTPERIFSLMEACGERLAKDDIKIRFPDYRVDPDLIETGLRLGVTFSLPEVPLFLNLTTVAQYSENKGRMQDWEHIAQHPVFRKSAKKCIENSTYGMGDWIEYIDTRPHMKSIVGEWLSEKIQTSLNDGALVYSADILTTFLSYPLPLWRAFPEQKEAFYLFNIAKPLMRSLHIGSFDEVVWPEYSTALSTFPNPDAVQISGTYPFAILFTEEKFIVLGPDGVCLEGDPPKHKGYPLESMIYSQGNVLMIFRKSWGNWKGQWFGQSPFKLDNPPFYRDQSCMLADGRMMFDGYRIFSPGDQEFESNYKKKTKVVTDGERFWKGLVPYEGKKSYVQFDPVSSKKVPYSPVPFLGEAQPHFLGVSRSIPKIVENSPIKIKDGIFAFRWTRDENYTFLYEDNCGYNVENHEVLGCFFHLPGCELPRVFSTTYSGYNLSDLSDVKSANDLVPYRRGGFAYLNPLFFSFYTARDIEGSKALRKISLKMSQSLLEHSQSEESAYLFLEENFKAISDEKLRKGIAGIAKLAYDQRNALEDLKMRLSEGNDFVHRDDPDAFKSAFSDFIAFRSYSDSRLLSQIEEVSQFLVGEVTEGTFRALPHLQDDWFDLIGKSGAIAYRYATSADPDEQACLERWMSLTKESPLVGPDLDQKMRIFQTAKTEQLPAWRRKAAGLELNVWQGSLIFSHAQNAQYYNPYYTGIEVKGTKKAFQIPNTAPLPLLGRGWGEREEFDTLLDLVKEKGGLPLEEILPDFIEETGLLEPEARLAILNWEHSEGVKKADLNWAMDVFEEHPKTQLDFFNEVVLAGPLGELWQPEKLKERLVFAWLDGFQRLGKVSVDTLSGFKKENKKLSSFLIREIQNPEESKALTQPREWFWKDGYQGRGAGFEDPMPYVFALDYLLYHTPKGSDVFENIGKVWQLLRDRCSDEHFLFKLFTTWEASVDYQSLIKSLKTYTSDRVDGKNTMLLAKADSIFVTHEGYKAIAYLHADALYLDSSLVSAFMALGEGGGCDAYFIFSEYVDDLIERSANSPVPAGEFECNPIFSAPHLVKEVCQIYKIDENAAALYLQILALPYPTNTNVRRWNRWKKKEHDKAIEGLLLADLVLDAKRSRAGRTIFLPGFWEPNKGGKPIEGWKFGHLDWVDADGEWFPIRAFYGAILHPPHVLFERAWQRIKEGDLPTHKKTKSSSRLTET